MKPALNPGGTFFPTNQGIGFATQGDNLLKYDRPNRFSAALEKP
jgi:hypothetical protein